MPITAAPRKVAPRVIAVPALIGVLQVLGRVLPRDKVQVLQARAHLQAVAGFLTVTPVADGLEAPLAVGPGEVAEFDTAVPHWFGAAGDEPVEILSLLGAAGERIHVRAAPRRRSAAP